MFLLMSVVAIAFWAWVTHRQLLPWPPYAAEGLGLIVQCILQIGFGAFLLYLAYVDLMVRELTVYTGQGHGGHLATPDVGAGEFWRGIAVRFVGGTGFIGITLALPFLKPKPPHDEGDS